MNTVVMKIKIALSSDILNEGIIRLINESRLKAVCDAGNEKSPGFNPDIVLFNSKQSIAGLTVQYPEARFILIDTGLKDIDLNCLLLTHHISGVIPPDTDLEMFYKALQVVHGGELWIEQQYIKILINKGQLLSDGEGLKGLSPQDKKIVALVCKGDRNNEIAEGLCLSETTIKAHVSRIFRILKVKNRAQLVCLARDNSVSGE